MQDLPNILIVDDDPTVIAGLGVILQDVGELRFAMCGQDALRLSLQSIPDLVLLDLEMPGMSGFEVCESMKASPLLADVPVIFITSHDGADKEVLGLALGAADFISKPPRPAQVAARVRMHLRTKQAADALRRAAFTDGLTGVANRRQFDEASGREWLRARRAGASLSLMMVDIDAFKRYNDHYGHQAGDQCLRAVAQAMQLTLHRPADLIARYGGEEFALLLPETDASGAQVLALRLLEAVDALRLEHAASTVAPVVSVSIGLSSYGASSVHSGWNSADSHFGLQEDRPALTDLIAAADQALYAAKEAGRRQARLLNIDDVGMLGRSVEVRPAALATCCI